jgi:Glycogen recognition site of AMP-activated protein kinase
MTDNMTDSESRLDAALHAMRQPPIVAHSDAAAVAARAVLASGPAARANTMWLRAAAAIGIITIGAVTASSFRDDGTGTGVIAAASDSGLTEVAEAQLPTMLPVVATSARPIVFEFDAPDARSVQVLGDFNRWSRDVQTMQRTGDGHWRVTTLLPPGRYVYAFLVDGQRFARDPARDPIEDRDFGVTGSELIVGEAPE